MRLKSLKEIGPGFGDGTGNDVVDLTED